MSTAIVTTPLGSFGTLEVDEGAGVLTVKVNAAEANIGLTQSLSLGISAVALVNAWAAATSNATLKAGLTELGTLLAALPA